MNNNNRQSRREFLKQLGLSTLALPLLPSLLPYGMQAHAQAGGIPKRFIFIRTAHGTRQENWDPFQIAPTQLGPNIKEGNLTSLFAGTGINKLLNTNFSPYLSQMTYIRGLDIPLGLGHNSGGALGHYQDTDGYQTIDQLLAKSPKMYTTNTPVIDSLLFSTYGGCSFMRQGGNIIRRQGFSSAQAAFDLLFNFSQGQNLNRNSKSISEALKKYTELKNNTRVSAEDKNVLDIQSSMLTEIDARLKQIKPVPPQTSPVPNVPTLSITQQYEAFVDVGILALLNQLTNVLVINIEEAEGVSPSSWHGASHDSEKAPSPAHYQASFWAAQKVFLRVIQKLSQIPEANGKSMLENSLVFWGGEMSQGAGHIQENMPVVLAGTGQGFIRPGRLLDYSQYGVPKIPSNNVGDTMHIGRPYTQLLNTILQSMGLTPAEYERNGKPGYGLIESANLSRNLRYKDMVAQIGGILPNIR